MPKNSLITTPFRIFKYFNIFKTLMNSVLHDNTLGEVRFMDQLFHKASYLKAATLAHVPFWVLQRQRSRSTRQPQTQEGGREGLKNSQPRSLRRHMWDNTQYSSQTLIFASYETETSEKRLREATHRSGKHDASRIQIPLMEDVRARAESQFSRKNIHQS